MPWHAQLCARTVSLVDQDLAVTAMCTVLSSRFSLLMAAVCLEFVSAALHCAYITRWCRFWVVGGLGARGLVYHAWLGKLVAAAIVARDEKLLPAQLLRWKSSG